jgi:hypothetical protein
VSPTPHADLVRRPHRDVLGPPAIYLAGALVPGVGSAAAWSLASALTGDSSLEAHLARALRGQLVGVAILLVLQGTLAGVVWAVGRGPLPAPVILAFDLVLVAMVWSVCALSGLWGAGGSGPPPLSPPPLSPQRGARVRFTPSAGRRTPPTPVVVEPTRSRVVRAVVAPPIGDRPTRRVERPR